MPDSRFLPVAISTAAILAASAALVLDWASPVQAAAFAAALVVAAAAGEHARRRTEAVLIAEIERRREAEQEARTANRAKSDFLANMSHELRTPLATVIAAADLLRAADLPPSARDHVQVIDASAELLLALIDDVLDFAKLEAGRLRLQESDFRLRELVTGVADLVAPKAAEKGLELAVEVAPEVPDGVRGDPARLRQVLLNLAGNAVKFTAQGRVEVGVDLDPEGEAARLRFAVRDTGVGISAADQGRIFETFYQADSSAARRQGGSGLGLAICKELVARMGGAIGLVSEPGAGSTFWFLLPLAVAEDVPARAAAEESPPPVEVDRSRLRVLVVDDHATNRRLALGHLAALGYRCAEAGGGEAALAELARARGAGEPFDAVLMDCQMPGLDGYETTRRLRRLKAEAGAARTPVIAVTAHARPEEREKCLAVGMDDYLAKPYRGAELDAVLGRWLAGRAEAPGDPPAADAAEVEPLFAERVAALEQLGEQTGEDVLGEAVSEYLSRGRALVAELQQACDRGDADALATTAHSLVGICGVLGDERLASTAQQIEAQALRGDLAGVGPALRLAEREYRQFAETLARM